MKKVFLTCFVAVATFLMMSCGKDVDLSGTTWKTSYSYAITQGYGEDSIHISVSATSVLTFINDESGTLTTSGTSTMEGMTTPLSGSLGFSYTFDGEKSGVLTYSSDGTTYNDTFTYNKDDETISIPSGSTDSRVPSTMVFTKQ